MQKGKIREKIMLLGFDLTEIARIEKSIESAHFTERVFTADEISYAMKKKRPAESLAAFFAAREAFGKALGTGLTGFSLSDVSIIHNENGKPALLLSGKAKEKAAAYNFEVSLSHTETTAGAVVIGYPKGE